MNFHEAIHKEIEYFMFRMKMLWFKRTKCKEKGKKMENVSRTLQIHAKEWLLKLNDRVFYIYTQQSHW